MKLICTECLNDWNVCSHTDLPYLQLTPKIVGKIYSLLKEKV
jgi:hypothetical protein